MTKLLISNETIHQEVLAGKDEVIQIRRYLHQHPEPSLKEFKTIKFIKDELDKLEITYENVGETGVIATLEGSQGQGKTILLRADIDALELPDAKEVPYKSTVEGLHHACGHDGHTAALLGASKILKKYQDDFAGTIKIAFQQAEEIGAGARQFVEGGFVKDVDEVFGLHLDSSVPVGQLLAVAGPTNASCDIFKITVHGRSAHVGTPQDGIDAALAAAAITVELQQVVARELSPGEGAVVAIGKIEAGTRYNIVANKAVLEGTVRTFSNETRAKVLAAVERIASGVAASHRATVEFENYDAAAPLINHQASAARAAEIQASIVGAENVITEHERLFGADDFADFLAVAPGIYARVGTRNLADSNTWYPHHHEKFDIDEEALALATELHVRYALDFLAE